MKYLNRLRYLGGFAFLLACAGTHQALADPISFFNTGVDANGAVLAAGVADSHYALVYSADGNGTTAVATTANAAWASDTSTAGWIGPGPDGGTSWSSGYYAYETTIDLTGYDATTAVFSGVIAGDDVMSIYLNRGGSAMFSGSGFSSATPFLINSGFVSGVNQIDFVIYNNYGPTGLLVDDGRVTATAVTPEPGTWLLLGTGMALGGWQVMRRREMTA